MWPFYNLAGTCEGKLTIRGRQVGPKSLMFINEPSKLFDKRKQFQTKWSCL